MARPNPSKAARVVRACLSEQHLTQTDLAKEFEVTQQAVSGWLTGRCPPASRVMVRLEELFGIPVSWWFEFQRSVRRGSSREEVAR